MKRIGIATDSHSGITPMVLKNIWLVSNAYWKLCHIKEFSEDAIKEKIIV